MALYKTICDHCGDTQEELRTLEEGPRQRCPKCKHKVRLDYGVPRMEVGGYSPMHPRKLRGKQGRRV